MPVTLGKTTLVLDGACTVEDALPLLEALQARPALKVSLKGCVYLHTAPLQVLIALRPRIASLPEEAFLARFVAPLLGPERS